MADGVVVDDPGDGRDVPGRIVPGVVARAVDLGDLVGVVVLPLLRAAVVVERRPVAELVERPVLVKLVPGDAGEDVGGAGWSATAIRPLTCVRTTNRRAMCPACPAGRWAGRGRVHCDPFDESLSFGIDCFLTFPAVIVITRERSLDHTD